MYKTWHFCPSITAIQQSPQCISCIFMNVLKPVYFLLEMAGWNKPKKPFFFNQGISICSSGSFRWSKNIRQSVKQVFLRFGNEQASWDKQKQKTTRKGKKSRQEVSCSWTYGRYRSARPHIHTSFTTLGPTPRAQPRTPKGKATQRNMIKQAKEGRLLWVVGCEVSHVTWRWDLAGVNIERVRLGLSPPGRGNKTCSILWMCPLTTSDGVSVLGKGVWSSAGVAGYAGCQSWLYFS